MVRRDDTKMHALAASRTLNPRPEKVTDPAFGAGGFFDPADLVQVKYEMVRRAEVADVPASRGAAEFGFSRQSLYSARAALRERGLAGLVPARPWTCWRTCWRPIPACGRRIWPSRSGTVSASASIRVRSSGRCSAAAPPGARTSRAAGRPPGRRPKADQSGSIHQDITAGDGRGAF